jgi:S1-C subfamily serine protease
MTGSAAALSLVLVLAAAMPAEAQERQRGRVQGMGPDGPDMNVWMTRRARLGVKVNLQARATDSVGAYIEAVTPGGPAEKAGLQSGDVITGLDGTSLMSDKVRVPADRSLPGMRLIELAAKLEPNDTVKVEYRRGKDARTTTLVTQDDPESVFMMGPDGRGGMRDFAFRFGDENWDELRRMHPDIQLDLERLQHGMDGHPTRVFISSELEDLELVPLNPDLGQYFGASEGVLVVRVPKESTLGLKGGDVVLSIDGRKVTGTSQLHRILRTYDGEEAIKFEVLRNRKKETVSGKVPKRPEVRMRTPKGDNLKMKHKSGERA